MHPPIGSQITFLYTRDLAETARFYEQIMGLPLKLDQGSCRIYQVSQDAYLGFCQRDSASERSSQTEKREVMLTFVTSQVDEWYHLLCERGITFEKPPAANARFNIYHCFLRDPNGYLVEIQRFLHPF